MATDEQVFVPFLVMLGRKRRSHRMSSRFSSPWTANDRLLLSFAALHAAVKKNYV